MSRNRVIRIPLLKAAEPAAQKRVEHPNSEIDPARSGERRETAPVSLGAFEQD
jgi:hypothetical protein